MTFIAVRLDTDDDCFLVYKDVTYSYLHLVITSTDLLSAFPKLQKTLSEITVTAKSAYTSEYKIQAMQQVIMELRKEAEKQTPDCSYGGNQNGWYRVYDSDRSYMPNVIFIS